jgi:hypothetical protein
LGHIAAFIAPLEPPLSLITGAMSKAFGLHDTACIALQRVIANLCGRIHRLGDIAPFDAAKSGLRAACPDPCVAIGLQFNPHGKRTGNCFAGMRPDLIGLSQYAQLVLNAMRDFVGHNIGGCEISARAKLSVQRRKEISIELNLAIRRTTKRPRWRIIGIANLAAKKLRPGFLRYHQS